LARPKPDDDELSNIFVARSINKKKGCLLSYIKQNQLDMSVIDCDRDMNR
jgi:hypothetical protein